MSENENSARPRCDFIYTKNSARPRSDFIYTKNFQEGRCDRKWRFYNKETAFAGVQHLGLDGVKSMFFAFVSSVEIHDWSLFK